MRKTTYIRIDVNGDEMVFTIKNAAAGRRILRALDNLGIETGESTKYWTEETSQDDWMDVVKKVYEKANFTYDADKDEKFFA